MMQKNHSPRCLQAILIIALTGIFAPTESAQAAVTTYQKDYILEIQREGKPFSIKQKRWYLENEKVRFAVTDDPGGAVVEFVNKENGTNHVAGDVWSYTENGKTTKDVYYGWNDTINDTENDVLEMRMHYQKYSVDFLEEENGAKTIKVTGQTAQQKSERWHTLQPDSGEMLIRSRLTNISRSPRRLYLRWHPFIFPSADRYGDTGSVLTPGDGDQIRKIRIGAGFDHWFRTHDPFWMAADYKSGEGIFATFEKDKVPVHFTWTNQKPRNPFKGSVTLETMPEIEVKAPGEFVETRFTYFPFSKTTDAKTMPLGLLTDKGEQERARRFLSNTKQPENLAMISRHSFAGSAYFDWLYLRRDLIGVRDWGFADCAIVGYPLSDVPMKVRMIGGVFDKAPEAAGFPADGSNIHFDITVSNEDGLQLFHHRKGFLVRPGVTDENYFDQEIAVPMKGIPDGRYTFRVEAIDPITRKVFHHHEMKASIFGQRVERESTRLAATLKDSEASRPFVSALAALSPVKVQDGRATIPIGVEDGSNIERKNFPVRLGVPFPQGAFAPNAPVRLLSPAGKPVAAQYSTMSIWPDKSLKWLGVDFQASCPPNGYVFYKLEIGKGVPIATAPSPNIAVADEEFIELNTGPMFIRVPRRVLSVPGEVFIDTNKDGRFAKTEKVVYASQPNDVWWLNKNRNFTMQLKGASGSDFTPGVEIESNGPESAVVKMTGWYLDENSKHVALGEVRLEVFRGKPTFKLWHQVTFTGSPWHDRLTSYGIKLRTAPGAFKSTDYEVDGKSVPVNGPGSLFQQSANRLTVTGEDKKVTGGNRSGGAFALRGEKGSMLLHHRDLWQLYPKKLSSNPTTGEVRIDYWPEEAGEHSFEPIEEIWIPSSAAADAAGTGASRTQEMTVDLSNQVKVEDAAAVYGEPVIACTPPSWIYQTRVLNNLHPYDPARYPEVEEYISSISDAYDRQRDFFGWYGQWLYGALHNAYRVDAYKWIEAGRLMHIGNEEAITLAPWLAYFRSGDRKYYNFARANTRHLMEVQSIRWNGNYPEYSGQSRRHEHLPWLGGGDKGHTMVGSFIEYYHADGYTPAWDMAKRTAASVAETSSGSWRYISNPLEAQIRMYGETADPKYKAVADRMWSTMMKPDLNDWYLGGHGSRMAIWYAPYNEEVNKLWREWATTGHMEDGKANHLFRSLDTYGLLGDATGNVMFAHEARIQLDLYRSVESGRISGVNPVYRGMNFSGLTHHFLATMREVPFAAEQIARSNELFPARFYDGGSVKETLIKEETDGEFTIWMSPRDAANIKITSPDGAQAQFKVEKIYSRKEMDASWPELQFVKIIVPADGKIGFYRIPGSVGYFCCSLKQVAFRCYNSLDFAAGSPLYIRPKDIGGRNSRIIMRGAPSASLELFKLDGNRIFSQTYVRPPANSVGIEHRFDLPDEKLLKVGDKVGILFPDVKEVPLFLNQDSSFDLPS